LQLRAYAFDLGESPGTAALANLDAATDFFLDWLDRTVATDVRKT
jgi:hypothetical protein